MKTTLMSGAVLVLAMLAVSACSKRDESAMGPAQKAGAAIDNAGDKVAKDLHDKLDAADQAAKDMAEAAKATGDQITEATKDAAQDASRGLDQATDNVGKKVERAGEKIQESARAK